MTEHALKISECFANDCIHTIVCIDGIKFNLVSQCGTTDSIFSVRQMRGKYIKENNIKEKRHGMNQVKKKYSAIMHVIMFQKSLPI